MPISMTSSTQPTPPPSSSWRTYLAEFEPTHAGLPPSEIVVSGVGRLRHKQAGSRMHRDYGEHVLGAPVAATLLPAPQAVDPYQAARAQCRTAVAATYRTMLEEDRSSMLGIFSSVPGAIIGAGMVGYGLLHQDKAWALTGAVLLGGNFVIAGRLQQQSDARVELLRNLDALTNLVDAYGQPLPPVSR